LQQKNPSLFCLWNFIAVLPCAIKGVKCQPQ
jgi:hypothetical protein